jgi:hypothetical protein
MKRPLEDKRPIGPLTRQIDSLYKQRQPPLNKLDGIWLTGRQIDTSGDVVNVEEARGIFLYRDRIAGKHSATSVEIDKVALAPKNEVSDTSLSEINDELIPESGKQYTGPKDDYYKVVASKDESGNYKVDVYYKKKRVLDDPIIGQRPDKSGTVPALEMRVELP